MMWGTKWTSALPKHKGNGHIFRVNVKLFTCGSINSEGKNLPSRLKARAHLGIKASEMGILYSITHFLVKVDMAETMPSLGIKDSSQCKMQCERPMIQEGSSMSSAAKDGDAEFPEGQHCPSPT